ncbi:hypothetical protein PMZ80_010558 [Knufia obscura]|uniref:DUF7770 domain-containing protein n=2 Tax=Knufia TaxID=430999 RepID=A0AAN8I3A3_9EURO|nr:hypothetical protein PMZ80_010558 [Knufia obscura]KAK5950089.1 hypothetical protein OHC33_008804 [Knufia fluminis]
MATTTQPPAYNTIAWIPPSAAKTYLNHPITHVRALCLPPGPIDPSEPDGKQTNHWILSLHLPNGISLALDPSPSGPNNTLVCGISVIDSTSTATATPNNPTPVKTLPLTPSPNQSASMTVESFLTTLKTHNLTNYTFSPTGQGCRFWIGSVADTLAQNAVVDAQEVETLKDALGSTWAGDGSEMEMEGGRGSGVVEGTFF